MFVVAPIVVTEAVCVNGRQWVNCKVCVYLVVCFAWVDRTWTIITVTTYYVSLKVTHLYRCHSHPLNRSVA
jgi:hypothetical protein